MARPTLLELANRTNKGNLIEIAEVLTEENEMLKDAVLVEANNLTSHTLVKRLTQPSGAWRNINQGVTSEASLTQPSIEGIGILEARSEIDKKLVDMAPNPARFRFTEDKAFLEGLGITMADAVIYANQAVTPEKINGLAIRYPSITTVPTVLGAGGTGSDLTSIWIIQWGENKVHFIYPKGSASMGLNHRDLGEQTVLDGDGKPYQAYVSLFQWDIGLAIHDDRCIGRLANIESAGTSNLFSPEQLNVILRRMKNDGKGSVMYANSTVLAQMDNDAMDKSNVQYTVQNVYGEPVTHYRGIPVRRMDSILITEDALT